jgi:hypothetical protein
MAGLAAGELQRQGAIDGQALALAVSAQARGDARQSWEALALLEGSQDLRARLAVQLHAARLKKGAEAERMLTGVLDEATRAGLNDLRREAELALRPRR